MENGIGLEEMSVTFCQDADCSQNPDEVQKIEFHTESNGIGNFLWFKTDRWSFSCAEDLEKLIDKVRAMESLI